MHPGNRQKQQTIGQAKVALIIARWHTTLVYPIEINTGPRGICGIFTLPNLKKCGSHWRPTWKAKLAFCRVVHRTVTIVVQCAIAFQIRRIRSLVLGIGWRTGHCPVHTEQSGVPNRPLLRAMRRPRIAQPTVGADDRWLTGQSGAPTGQSGEL